MDAAVIKFNSGIGQLNKNLNKFNSGMKSNYKSLSKLGKMIKKTEKNFTSLTKNITDTQKSLEQAFKKPITVEFQASSREVIDELKESIKTLVKDSFQISIEVENKTVINSMKDMCNKPKEVSNAVSKSEGVINKSFHNISKKSDGTFGKMKDKISSSLKGIKGKVEKSQPKIIGKITYESKEKIKRSGKFRLRGSRMAETTSSANNVNLEKGGNTNNINSSRFRENISASGRMKESVSRRKKVTATFSTGEAGLSPGILKKGASLAGSGALAAANAAVDVAAKMISSGNELQHQKTDAMQTIRGNDKSKSSAEVAKLTDNFIKNLQKDAAKSPLRQNEMIDAGNRALKITGGDTNSAREMVKVAQSMVAANSGTNLSEALDALKSLESGDASGMANFGISKKDAQNGMNSSGGVDGYIKNIGTQFAPDLQNSNNSAEGQWNTLQGKFDSVLSNGGTTILDSMVPVLEGANSLMDTLMPNIEIVSTAFAEVIGQVFSWIGENMPAIQEAVGGVFDWLGEKFGWISGETGFLKEVFSTTFTAIQEVLNTAWSVIKPIFDLIGNGALIVYALFKKAFPGIKGVVEGVWKVVGPLLKDFGSLISAVADGVGKVAKWLGEKVGIKIGKADEGGKAGGGDKSAGGGKAIPGKALGTSYFAGGLTTVDEHGGELKILPNGTKIIPHDLSKNILNDSGGNNFSIVVNAQNMNTDQVVNDLVPKLKLALANM